ncbi:MAG: hypothetical protein KOO63_02910, partial [Bacteroidales bacterium]|nr:hypothetical protein [Candidatus Latescibacterota bacterium]
ALYHLEGERAEPVFAPAMEFPMETIVETPAAHEFACRPSYVVADDGVTGINTPRLLPLESGLRSAGYHVHLGCGQLSNSFTARQPEAPLARLSRLLHEPSRHPELAQMCDLVSALPALLLPRDPLEAVRRDVIGYGRASEFRSPKYGFEYRALSSSMLRSPVWSWWAHSSVRDALALVVAGVDFRDKFDRAEVSHAINTADFAAAEKLWTKVKGLLATEVWPMARGHRARGGSSVVLNPKGVQYMEFQMKHGLGRTRGHKAEWLNQNSSAYHRDWRNYSCRSVPRRQGWDEFKATWTPEKNCVEA